MSDTEGLLLLDRQLCFAVYSASNLLTRLYRKHLEKLGLTYSQYIVMLVLWEKDSLLVNEIGEHLFLTSASLTPILKRLESAGYIDRIRSSHDERTVRNTLTKKGRNLEARAREMLLEIICDMGMESNEVESLRSRLNKMVKTILQLLETKS